MAHLIDKDALVAEIKNRRDSFYSLSESCEKGTPAKAGFYAQAQTLEGVLSFLDTLEVKEVDLELITGWFNHIAQIADDRMTLTNQRMTDAHALDEIKCLARNSSEFITKHYKAQKGEQVMTQEDKELLLKDLCARLPYGVRIYTKDGSKDTSFVLRISDLNRIFERIDEMYDYDGWKPYLRPMSSIASLISAKEWSSLGGVELIDWYNANHIDYRGFIEKGLAIEVTEENNPYE